MNQPSSARPYAAIQKALLALALVAFFVTIAFVTWSTRHPNAPSKTKLDPASRLVSDASKQDGKAVPLGAPAEVAKNPEAAAKTSAEGPAPVETATTPGSVASVASNGELAGRAPESGLAPGTRRSPAGRLAHASDEPEEVLEAAGVKGATASDLAPEVVLAPKKTGDGATVSTPHHDGRFQAGAITYAPKDEKGTAAETWVWSYEFQDARRGGAPISRNERPAPETKDLGIFYKHPGGLMESYTSLPHGFEQEFTFQEIPLGTGDLVVTGRVTTKLERRETSLDVSFVDETGTPRLSYGRARVRDAEDKTTDVTVRFDADGTLALVVADSWLKTAKAPIVIDPLVGSNFQATTSTSSETFCWPAYNPKRNEYMVGYVLGGNTVRVTRISATGTILTSGGLAVDTTAGTKSYVSCNYSKSAIDHYVLTYTNNSLVYAAVVDWDGTVIAAAGRVYNPGGTPTQLHPRATYDPSRDKWLIVWDDTSQSATLDILGREINTSGTLDGTTYILENHTTQAYTFPHVTYDATHDQFFYAWQSNDTNLYGRILKGDISAYVTSQITVSNATNSQFYPHTAFNSRDNEFFVVWIDTRGTNQQIYGQRLDTAGTLLGSNFQVSDDGKSESDEDVQYSPVSNQYLVVWDADYTPTSKLESRGRLVASGGAMLGASTNVSSNPLGTSPFSYNPIAAWNSVSDEFVVMWQDNRNGGATPYDIYGQRVQPQAAPQILRTDPPANATGVFLDQNVVIDFSRAMLSSTINTTNITLKVTSTGSPVTGTVSYNSTSQQATFDPTSNLSASAQYTLTVTTGVQDSASTPMPHAYTITFTTGTVAALADSDGDGLLNVEETALGTNPNLADTDGDGINDLAELCDYHTDPTKADTDGDGTNDGSDANPLSPNPGAPDTTPPILIGLFPGNNTNDVALQIPSKAKFNEPLSAASITATSFVVKNVTDGNITVSGTYSTEDSGKIAVFTPTGGWLASKTYSIQIVSGASGITDSAGNHVQVGKTNQFATRSISSETLAFGPVYSVDTVFPYIDAIEMDSDETTPTGGKDQEIDNGDSTGKGPTDLTTNGPEFCSCRKGKGKKPNGNILFSEPASATAVYQVTEFQQQDRAPDKGGKYASLHYMRTFRNSLERQGIFGWNWFFAFDMKFAAAGDQNGDTFTDYQLTDYDGRQVVFLSSGSSSFTAPAGYYDTLKVSSNIVRLRTRDGHRFVFDLNQGGLLTDMYDRCENHTTFVREQNGTTGVWRLKQVVDNLDRTTNFAYYTTAGKLDLVQTITDWNGSVWSYDYDSNRNLSTVTTPATDWLNEAGVLQSNAGKTTTYTYTSGLGSPKDHSLTSATDARGNVLFRIAYDANDHLLQMDFGGGTSFHTFDWASSGFTVEKETEIDRAGNATEIRMDANLDVDQVTQFTAGFHSGEPASYVTAFKHNSNHELTQITYPRGNVERFILTSKGFLRQRILKTSTSSSADTDIVYDYKLDTTFGTILRVTEPRGNTPPVASTATAEDVDAQTVRTFTVSDAIQRDAYTTYFFYDHENIASRLSTESTEMGVTVSLAGTLPKSYGRPNGTDPPDTTNVFKDVDGDGVIDHGGNLYAIRGPRPKVVDPANPSAFQASRQVIEYFHTYNQYGQPIFKIHPDSVRDRNEWVAGSFNLTTNPNRGFLKYRVMDTSFGTNDVDLTTGIPNVSNPGGRLDLTTQFAYDVVGNVTSVTNARGFVTTFAVNRLNQVKQATSPAPFSYIRKFSYDGDNNMVKLEVQNVVPSDTNDNGIQDTSGEQTSGSPSYFAHVFKYNSGNALIEQDLDATGSTPSTLVTSFQRDLKQRATRVTKPELNFDSVSFDERDLVYKTVRGASDTTVSETTTFNYDANGNLSTVIDDDGNTNADMTYTYDLFDRRTFATDEIGNAVETQYDLGSFIRQVIARGQKTGASGEVTTTVLAQRLFEYDEASRIFQSDAAYFDVIAGTALTHGSLTPPVNNASKLLVTSQIVSAIKVYDANSLTTYAIDDNVHKTVLAYDGVHRLSTVTDHIGSSKTYTYDKSSNVIRVRDIDLDGDTLASTTFYQEAFFDELDRVIATVTNLGNTRRFLWDSRGNLTQSADAMGTQTGNMSALRTASEHGTFPQTDLAINARGNTIRYTYDGLSRPLSTLRDLRTGGIGSGTVSSTLTTSQTWDGNSRCKNQTDGNGNVTAYCYDHNDRLHETTYADGRVRRVEYNKTDTVKIVRDPRNVITQYTYDAAERLTDVAVSNLPYGQGQTTFLAYQYDGLDRTKRAEDNDSITIFNFDSLSRTIKETQSVGTGTPRTLKTDTLTGITRNVSSVLDGVGNRKQLTYPGGQVIDYTYDAVDRLDLVKDGATNVADYRYVGMGGRRVQKTLANGTALFLSYDGERRVTRYDHRRTSDNLRVRGFEYAWDRENNRRYEQRLTVNTSTTESTGPGEFALYDSIYRLTRFRKDVATASLDAMANNATSVTEPSSTRVTDYALDAANNRSSITVDSVTTSYTLQSGVPTKDASMNQYTTVGTATLSHDDGGNLLNDGANEYFWDFADRIVQVITSTDDVRYSYDALGRRIAKRSQNSKFSPVLYWWDGWQCVEETDQTTPTPTVIKKYVFGSRIDEPLRVTLPDYADVNNNANTTELVDLYFHDNSIGSIVAVTKSDGAVVEAYRYDAYGAVEEVRDKNGSVVTSGKSPTKNSLLFQGRQLDYEEGSGLYYFRNRYYSPSLGRFISRDPKGVWGDENQLGNGQSAFGNNPLNRVDPLGLQDSKYWNPEEAKKANEAMKERFPEQEACRLRDKEKHDAERAEMEKWAKEGRAARAKEEKAKYDKLSPEAQQQYRDDALGAAKEIYKDLVRKLREKGWITGGRSIFQPWTWFPWGQCDHWADAISTYLFKKQMQGKISALVNIDTAVKDLDKWENHASAVIWFGDDDPEFKGIVLDQPKGNAPQAKDFGKWISPPTPSGEKTWKIFGAGQGTPRDVPGLDKQLPD